MKILWLIVLGVSFVALKAGAIGGNSGGGGSLVMINGHLEPADLHYVLQDDTIPPTFVPVDFKKYPQATKSLQLALDFLKTRTRKAKAVSEWNLEHTEFYFVPKLSGTDAQTVDQGLAPFQVGFTREIIDVSGSNKPVRDIVEILQQPFEQITEYQGLFLLHELMHHKIYGQHSVISPLIKSLSVLLPLKQKQDAGDRSPLTDEQFEQDKILNNILVAITNQRSDRLTRNGGGLIAGKDLPDSNFVGLTSILYENAAYSYEASGNTLIDSFVMLEQLKADNNTFINSSCMIQDGWDGEFSDNTVVNSDIDMTISYFGREHHNTFKNVVSPRLTLSPMDPKTPVRTEAYGNVLENIQALFFGVTGSSNIVRDFKQGDGENFWSLWSALEIKGNNNRIEHVVEPGSASIYINGNDAAIDGLSVGLDATVVLNQASEVHNVKVLDWGRGNAHVCAVRVPAKKVIRDQTVSCVVEP